MNRRHIFSIHTLLTPGNRKRAAVFNRCTSDGQNTTSREYSTDRHPELFDVLIDLERAHGSTFVYDYPSPYGQPLLYVAIDIPGWPPGVDKTPRPYPPRTDLVHFSSYSSPQVYAAIARHYRQIMREWRGDTDEEE